MSGGGGEYEVGTTYTGFALNVTTTNQTACEGDSGGPVIRNGKVIGVISTGDEHCLVRNYIHAAYVLPAMLAAVDADGDGVSDAYDNCPTKPNANQANCDEGEESQLGQQKLGDVCDPDPCVHNMGVRLRRP
jgi:hypothetical protein